MVEQKARGLEVGDTVTIARGRDAGGTGVVLWTDGNAVTLRLRDGREEDYRAANLTFLKSKSLYVDRDTGGDNLYYVVDESGKRVGGPYNSYREAEHVAGGLAPDWDGNKAEDAGEAGFAAGLEIGRASCRERV